MRRVSWVGDKDPQEAYRRRTGRDAVFAHQGLVSFLVGVVQNQPARCHGVPESFEIPPDEVGR